MPKTRWILATVCGLLLVVGLGLLGVHRALKHVPEPYRRAMQADPTLQREASDQMLQRAAALRSDLEKEGRWQALFTADQINGWLAVDLAENHPRTLPPSLSDPRVAIEPDRMMLFCKFRHNGLEGVATLAVQPYLPEPNVLALRVDSMRAGALPWGMDQIVDAISRAARRAEIRLQWLQDGDPVAQVPLSQFANPHGKTVRIETFQLGDGEIFVEGTTE